MSTLLYISEERVRQLLEWESTFQATQTAMCAISRRNGAIQNPRTFTGVTTTNNLLLTMPGYLNDSVYGALACKMVTMFPENSKLVPALPSILANIALFDDVTGELIAVVAGTEITAWRTAAASVVATKHLVPDITTNERLILAVFGAGTQGEIHAIALYHFFKFKQVKIYNRTHAKAVKLAASLEAKHSTTGVFVACENDEECAKDADVIVTATYTSEPIVKAAWLKHNVHINAIGAGQSHYSELEPAIYNQADIYIDHIAGAQVELRGLWATGVKFRGEIGQVINGDLIPQPNAKITVFQSLGMAVEDCAMAKMIYNRHMTQK